MECPSCHAAIAASAKFCPHCGQRVEQPAPPGATLILPPEQHSQEGPQERKGNETVILPREELTEAPAKEKQDVKATVVLPRDAISGTPVKDSGAGATVMLPREEMLNTPGASAGGTVVLPPGEGHPSGAREGDVDSTAAGPRESSNSAPAPVEERRTPGMPQESQPTAVPGTSTGQAAGGMATVVASPSTPYQPPQDRPAPPPPTGPMPTPPAYQPLQYGQPGSAQPYAPPPMPPQPYGSPQPYGPAPVSPQPYGSTPGYSPQSQSASRVLSPGMIAGLLGALLMIVSPFLTWASLGSQTASGIAEWPGQLALVLGLVAGGLFVLRYARGKAWAALVGALAAVLGLGLSLLAIIGLNEIGNDVGIGVFLLLLGSLLVIVGAVLLKVLRPRQPA
ncbi:MAG: hypothetical protein KatS3mg057_1817 [Herpetosiphonaceae bacterium]|nr:MAG: hypothetical protein KatS3mg057_1817 [Herpetosiphonaceae bacterium]